MAAVEMFTAAQADVAAEHGEDLVMVRCIQRTAEYQQFFFCLLFQENRGEALYILKVSGLSDKGELSLNDGADAPELSQLCLHLFLLCEQKSF